MNILLLGGTGAIGMHVRDLLLKNGENVYITSRSSHSSADNLHFFMGDAHDPAFLNTILSRMKWDAIIDFMVYSTSEFLQKHKALLSSTSRYVFLSTGRVFAETNGPITETSQRLLEVASDPEFCKSDDYALSKARQEDVLHNSSFSNWFIIRPYITYASNRLQLGVMEKEDWLYRALHGREVLFPQEMAPKKTTLTYGVDVASVIVQIVRGGDFHRGMLNVTSGIALSWNEVIQVYAQHIKEILNIDLRVKLVDLTTFYTFRPSVFQVKYDRIYDRIFDNSNTVNAIGQNPFVSPSAGIRLSLDDFKKSPSFGRIPWGLEAVKDRLVYERTKLNEIQGFADKTRYLLKRYVL